MKHEINIKPESESAYYFVLFVNNTIRKLLQQKDCQIKVTSMSFKIPKINEYKLIGFYIMRENFA